MREQKVKIEENFPLTERTCISAIEKKQESRKRVFFHSHRIYKRRLYSNADNEALALDKMRSCLHSLEKEAQEKKVEQLATELVAALQGG